MIVAKFGGSCMLSRNLNKVSDVVTSSHKIIVVSASGKNFDGDTKVTDYLIKWHDSGYDMRYIEPVCQRYEFMCRQHAICIDYKALLSDVISRCLYFCNKQYTMSVGEELSARIMASYLHREYLEAEKVIRLNGNKVDLRATCKAVRQAVQQDKLYVMGGFYGGCGSTRSVMSRGGGDVTGAVVARALNASIYENWTDVDGVYVANPRKVSFAKSLPCVTYNDMYVLAKNGAEVLHPDSIKPLARVAIPIHIRNIYNQYASGTLIQNQADSGQLVIGITDKFDGKLWRTVVVCKNNLSNVICNVLSCLSQENVNVKQLQGKDNYCAFVTDEQILQQVCKALLLTPSHNSVTI